MLIKDVEQSENEVSDHYSDTDSSSNEEFTFKQQIGHSGLELYLNAIPDDVNILKLMVLELYRHLHSWPYFYQHRIHKNNSHLNQHQPHPQVQTKTKHETKDREEVQQTTYTKQESTTQAGASTNTRDTQTEDSEKTDDLQEQFKTEMKAREEESRSREKEVNERKKLRAQCENPKAEMSEVKQHRQLHDENEQCQTKLQKYEIEMVNLKEENKKLRTTSKAMTEQNLQLIKVQKLSEDILDELEKTKAELDETKTRLSQLMSQKLTDGNPNIADLSDKNRPTKLAERYTELYDNQWTDAFDEISRETQRDEKDVIGLLKNILYDVLEYCQIGSTEQLNDLMAVLHLDDQAYTTHEIDTVKVLLKDCRKKMAEVGSETMFARYLQSLTVSERPVDKIAMYVPQYVKECFKICWMMCIQNPPVELDQQCVKRGDKFNNNIYKAYTNNGHYVNYVVWPAMFLHNGGPVLCKGVAQGMTNNR